MLRATLITLVFDPIQKYKFESKSQQVGQFATQVGWCLTQYKNTNLKANHNSTQEGKVDVEGV